LAIGVLQVIVYIQHDPATTVNGDIRAAVLGPKIEVELSKLV
jgi:hypothetical protein